MSKDTAELSVTNILDAWFGEALEDAEDEQSKRKYLYQPLIDLVRGLAFDTPADGDDGAKQ